MTPVPSLQLITSPHPDGFAALAADVASALSAGVRLVQWRDKRSSAMEAVTEVRALKSLCLAHQARLIVNDRLDVALAAGADGVHLGEDDLPWQAARRLAPAPFLIGVSVDREELLERAFEAQADYCGVGPAYPTRTKHDAGDPQPLMVFEKLARARGDRLLPIIAVGGIVPGDAARLIAAGADGVAVSAGILKAANIAAATRALIAELDEAHRAVRR